MSYRAYLAFQKHGILPHDFIALPSEEQAFLLACDLTEHDELQARETRARRRLRRR